MVFGGYNGTASNNLVTLFNWITLETCSLPNLPYDVGGPAVTTGFGLPMFCGGRLTPGSSPARKTCYKFNPGNKRWIQV